MRNHLMRKIIEKIKSVLDFVFLRNTHYALSNYSRGQLTIQILLLGFVTMTILAGFVLWSDTYVRNVSRERDKSQAFTIAETGIEYYRWHLAHAPGDFQDGTATSGPYLHPYFDKDNVRLGEFELDITPPATGTTIITVQSTGRVDADPTAEKIIRVKMGLPSLAQFSVAANSDVRFGEGTEVYGQVHSNGGIRFDGVAYNVVRSAKEDYNDPDHSGNNEFGVHTHVSPIDPDPDEEVPVRTDVFKAGRSFPVPALDFSGITQDIANIKAIASSTGHYYAPSGQKGYHLTFKTNGTYDVRRVTALISYPGCNSNGQGGWGTWSIKTETFISSSTIPDNGAIFFEDDAWVDGQIDGERVTVAAGKFPDNPANRKSITVNNDLLYTNYDGTDVIGLIAQENLNVGLVSEDDLRIDAATVAQNGRVGRHYYDKNKCQSTTLRTLLTTYGMIATNGRYGFAYTDNTGYASRVISYDGYLLYGPPPYFPITAGDYVILSWEEVK